MPSFNAISNFIDWDCFYLLFSSPTILFSPNFKRDCFTFKQFNSFGALITMPNRFLEGFLKSWGVILASEIGDKTFFIAAVMAMRNSRQQVQYTHMGIHQQTPSSSIPSSNSIHSHLHHLSHTFPLLLLPHTRYSSVP